MEPVGGKEMKIWVSQKSFSLWVGVLVTLLALVIGVAFYWSKGIVFGIGGFLGLIHAAMGVGLFFGVGVYLLSRKPSNP